MKTYGEWRYILTSVLDGDEKSVSRLSRFTHWVTGPGTLWIVGWVDFKVV
jgi:hypothetical protein